MKKTIIMLILVVLTLAGCSSEAYEELDASENLLAISNTSTVNTPTMESSWDIDVTDLNALKEDATAIVKVKVISVGAIATFEYAQGALPKTAIQIAMIEVLKGNSFEIDEVFFPGGTVSLQQVYESLPASAEKSGVAAMSEDDRPNTYETYFADGHIDLQPGETYVLILKNPFADTIMKEFTLSELRGTGYLGWMATST